MADSPEHTFISEALDASLVAVAGTGLLGIREAQRRTFDYGCLLLRDFSRPLVSQVLWSHSKGVDKDIRTLLHDGGASLKLYFVRDNVKNRAQIEEIVRSYREQSTTASLLRGLRIIPVPQGFDADSEQDRSWMKAFLRNAISRDLLFAVVFGKITASDVATFSDHAGPLGLKFAALQIVTTFGLEHGPTFHERIGYKGSPLREVLTMLGATNLIGRVGHAVMKVPSLKGRFFLDLCRRLIFEHLYCSDWSEELRLMLRHLNIEPPLHGHLVDPRDTRSNVVTELIYSLQCANSEFGIDIMADVNLSNPSFFSSFEWKKFASASFGTKPSYYDSDDDLDLFHE